MYIGNIISKIRRNKNIPVKYLTKNCMSKSTYDYFIEGKTDISTTKFNTLINRLNLSWNEFDYIKHDNYFRLTNNMKIYILNKNVLKLKHIRTKIYSKIKNKQSLKYDKYFHLFCILSFFIEIFTNNKINTKYKKIIKHYLLSRYSWTYYELSLFNESFFIFNSTEINIFIKRILKDLQDYKVLKPYEDEYIRLLMNIILWCIKKKKLIIAHKIMNKISHTKIRYDEMLERLSIKYIKGIIMIIEYKKGGFNLMENVLKCFNFITPNIYYPAMKNTYNKILQIYGIKNKLKDIYLE